MTNDEIQQALPDIDRARLALEHHRSELDRYRAELDRFRIDMEARRPVYDGAIRFAEMTIRSLLILNGGATLGLFTIAGNADKLGLKPKVDDLSWMAIAFGAGAALAVITAFMAYVTQILYIEITPDERANRIGNRCRYVAVFAGVLSMVCFFYALLYSRYLFK